MNEQKIERLLRRTYSILTDKKPTYQLSEDEALEIVQALEAGDEPSFDPGNRDISFQAVSDGTMHRFRAVLYPDKEFV